MGKNKPRHNPDKKQNLIGDFCQWYEFWQAEDKSKGGYCEGHFGDGKICKGNPHNCVKTKYSKLASMSDKQKTNK